ncbi:hypothetical protein GGR50DRAFT_78060 [Xylaria sp. CBS 124048]|nr:hypothetical protein GGR50DRAFT_78060 [Xylaria sp. CBS 124048]
MGLERRQSRASHQASVSLDAVLSASTATSRLEDRAQLATAHSIHSRSGSEGDQIERGSSVRNTTPVSMSPSKPPRPTVDTGTRSIRSSSSASRHANRLSLTLPIAPPTSFPSRPTPTPSTPPTPGDASIVNSPAESDDFIIAIAAQERRVLELREELARAEVELKRLHRQWTVSEACKKRPPNTVIEPPRALAPAINLKTGPWDFPVASPSSELERRKAILLAQSQTSPRYPKRTVIRGGHTRALSLLSPIRSIGDLSNHDGQDSARSTDSYTTPSTGSNNQTLTKRATWAPLPTAQQSAGVKQLASDFKQGLWTFVEDLRQAAVGDEAISGTTHRTAEMGFRSNKMDGDQNMIRPSATNRTRVSTPAEGDSSSDPPSRSSTDSPSDRFQKKRVASKPEPKARKHFSWTPLTFENFNDDDWSNWDSASAKTSRWSGSTVNGDVAAAGPEKSGENEVTLSRQCSSTESGPSSALTLCKLEDLPQAILNHIMPINLKNTTSNFLKEWEKSLSPPPQTSLFEAGLQDLTRSMQ